MARSRAHQQPPPQPRFVFGQSFLWCSSTGACGQPHVGYGLPPAIAPGVDQAEMICYPWDISGRAWEIWCCHPPDSTQRRGTARWLLEGKGMREHGKGRRDGCTTVRDGAALRQWGAFKAPQWRGKARAWQGTARRLHDGEGRRGVCAPGK